MRHMLILIRCLGSSLSDFSRLTNAHCVQPSQESCTIKGARDVLFNDLDENEAERLTKLLRPTSMHAFDSPAPPAAWADPDFAGKIAFIRCMKDQALPPFLQDMFLCHMEEHVIHRVCTEVGTRSSHPPSMPRRPVAGAGLLVPTSVVDSLSTTKKKATLCAQRFLALGLFT